MALDAAYRPCPPDPSTVAALLADREQATGHPPLSDPLAIDVQRGAGVLTAVCRTDATDHELTGIAQLSGNGGTRQLQTVLAPGTPDADRRALVEALASAALAASPAGTDAIVDWWVPGGDDAPAADEAATALGFTLDRELLIMVRPLPTAERATITTRAFVPGRDEPAWLDVNNRAFAGHAEQGRWTVDTLHERMGEPWFDPDGFRLFERDGTLMAFCWTKVHGSGRARVGEIYVIGVDPVAHGQGLGRQATQAGLDWMSDQGIDSALLYVAGDNAAAVGLYTSMGFVVQRRDRAYRRRLDENPVTS